MRVAVYSGSFNPLHIGHLSIMRYLTMQGDYDRVYLLVSPQSPFKDASNNETAISRIESARQAVARHPELDVRVDDIELMMPPPHYTVRTLRALQEREPGNSFTLVIGADNLEVFRKWYCYKEILRDFGVAVCPRDGIDMPALKQSLLDEDPSYRIDLLDAPIVNISSTEIREEMLKGIDVSELLM